MSNYSRYDDPKPESATPTAGIVAGIVGVAVGLLALITVVHTIQVVGPHEVGVVVNASSIDRNQTPLSSGPHMVAPFASEVRYVNTNQQSHPFDELHIQAGNNQEVIVDGMVSYHVDPKQAAEFVIQTNGQDDPEVLIKRLLAPAFRDYMQEVVYGYPTFADAKLAQGKIRDTITKRLKGTTDAYGLYVDSVYFNKFNPSPTYQGAADAAAKAVQDQQTARNEREAALARAQTQADVNVRISQGVTELTLRQRQLDLENRELDIMAAKWNGALPAGGSGVSLLLPVSGKQ